MPIGYVVAALLPAMTLRATLSLNASMSEEKNVSGNNTVVLKTRKM